MPLMPAPKPLVCDDVQAQLPKLLAGRLGVEQSARLRGHMRRCAACAQACQEAYATRTGQRTGGDPSGILACTTRKPPPRRPRTELAARAKSDAPPQAAFFRIGSTEYLLRLQGLGGDHVLGIVLDQGNPTAHFDGGELVWPDGGRSAAIEEGHVRLPDLPIPSPVGIEMPDGGRFVLRPMVPAQNES